MNMSTLFEYLIRTVPFAAFLFLTACDPAFVKSYPVHAPEMIPGNEFPVAKMDVVADAYDFVRIEPRPGQRERLQDKGDELVLYFERTVPGSSNFESLSLVSLPEKQGYRMDLFAFIALREPVQLRGFRQALSILLCENGYAVETPQQTGCLAEGFN